MALSLPVALAQVAETQTAHRLGFPRYQSNVVQGRSPCQAV
jgi:hypothetical protein